MDENKKTILTDEDFIRLKVEFFNSDFETKDEFLKFKGIENKSTKFNTWNKLKREKDIPSDIIEVVKKEKVLQCQKIIDQFNSIKNKSAYGYSERDRNIMKAFKNISRSEINLYDKNKNMGNIKKDTEMKVFKKETKKPKTKSKTQVNKSKKHLFENENINNGLSINQTDTTGMTQLDRLKEYTKDIQGNFDDTSEGLYEKYKHKLLQDLMVDVSDDSTISVKERLDLFKSIKLELGELEAKKQIENRPNIQVKIILDKGDLSIEEQIDVKKHIESLNANSTKKEIDEDEIENNDNQKKKRLDKVVYFVLFKEQSEAFLKLTEKSDVQFVLYGGGARGGKTYLGVLWIVFMMLAYPGSTWAIGREIKASMTRSVYKTIKEIFSTLGLISGEKRQFASGQADYNWNGKDDIIEFFNGSLLYLIALKIDPSDKDFNKIGGMELTGFLIEEAQETSKEAFDILKPRLSNLFSKKHGWKLPQKGLLTANPGVNWVYTEIYKPFEEGTLQKEYYYIKSLLKNNIYLDYEQVSKSYNTMSEHTRNRMLNGIWGNNNSAGALFKLDFIYSIFKRNEFVSNEKMKEILGDKTRYISIDLSGNGKDKTVIFIWEGNKVIDIITIQNTNQKELSEMLVKLEEKYGVVRKNVIIDIGGIGGAFIDFYPGFTKFDGSAKPLEKVDVYGKIISDEQRQIYANLRAQCYFHLSEEVENLNILVKEFPEKQLLIDDLSAISEKQNINETKKLIIPKSEIFKIIQRSPDFSDALMMKMYFNVKNKLNKQKSGAGKGFRFFNI